MKSEFKVTLNCFGGNYYYAVYRTIDTQVIDHSGNREVVTPYLAITREEAQKIADSFNKILREAKEGY